MTGGTQPRVSVKTKKEIPKEKIMDCIRQLKDVHADAPVEIGDVLLENVAGTGAEDVYKRQGMMSMKLQWKP